jgi:hypothetical protein
MALIFSLDNCGLLQRFYLNLRFISRGEGRALIVIEIPKNGESAAYTIGIRDYHAGIGPYVMDANIGFLPGVSKGNHLNQPGNGRKYILPGALHLLGATGRRVEHAVYGVTIGGFNLIKRF